MLSNTYYNEIMNRPHNPTTTAIMLSVFGLTNWTLLPALSLTTLHDVSVHRWGFTCCQFCRALTWTWPPITVQGSDYIFVLSASALFHTWPVSLPPSEPRGALEFKRYKIIRSPGLFPSLFPSITIVSAKWDLYQTQQSLLIQLHGLAADSQSVGLRALWVIV